MVLYTIRANWKGAISEGRDRKTENPFTSVCRADNARVQQQKSNKMGMDECTVLLVRCVRNSEYFLHFKLWQTLATVLVRLESCFLPSRCGPAAIQLEPPLYYVLTS